MMRKTLALLSLSLGISLVIPVWSVVAQIPKVQPLPLPNPNLPPLPPTNPNLPPQPVPIIPPQVGPPLQAIDIRTDCIPAKSCLGWDEQIWSNGGKPGDFRALLQSIDNSLRYLATGDAMARYQNYPIKEINLDRVRRSLLRFRQLVVESKSPAQLQAAVRREFTFYKSVGNDGNGTVKFTSYYEPVYTASRKRTALYKYPLYRVPPDFSQWAKPHPKRIDLEGHDALLGDKSKLHGLELVWMRSRLEAFLVQVQGSAKLKLTNGTTTTVGFAGGTDYPWTSLGKELVKDGKVPLKGMSLPRVIQYFEKHPKEMNNYLPRWERFIFFKETGGAPPTGSIHVPVTPERSIATDKSLMPPGALALVHTSIPYPTVGGRLMHRTVSRFVLDQDTGSAIKGPGRVDYFMGSGKLAGDRAGITGGNGTLYYLLLKE